MYKILQLVEYVKVPFNLLSNPVQLQKTVVNKTKAFRGSTEGAQRLIEYIP